MHGYNELRANIVAKKAQSTHVKMLTNAKMTKKMTKSAHLLGDVPGSQRSRDVEMVGLISNLISKWIYSSITSIIKNNLATLIAGIIILKFK